MILTKLWRLFWRRPYNVLPSRRCLYYHHDKVWGHIDIFDAKAEIVALHIDGRLAKIVEPTDPSSVPWILVSYTLHCDKTAWHTCDKTIITRNGLNYWPVKGYASAYCLKWAHSPWTHFRISDRIRPFYLLHRDRQWDVPSRQLVSKLTSNLSGE